MVVVVVTVMDVYTMRFGIKAGRRERKRYRGKGVEEEWRKVERLEAKEKS